MKTGNFVQALAQIAGKLQIPLGVQWTDDKDTNREISVSRTNMDSEQMIERLITSCRGYEFDVRDGIVHIYPAWTKANRQDFVNLKLREFSPRSTAGDSNQTIARSGQSDGIPSATSIE